MTGRMVVFGGTGFLGSRIADALKSAGQDVVVAMRHPDKAREHKAVHADVTDMASIVQATAGADGVVNAVSLYVESGETTFQDIHVEGARNVARAAEDAGAQVVHVSGIGSDPGSSSPYVAARGQGEKAVCEAAPEAVILRPAVIFGPGDAFLSGLADIIRKAPVVPLFGNGQTKLQPVFVGDVAETVARVLASSDEDGMVFELGGPDVLTYRAVLERLMQWTGRRRLLTPFPMAGWSAAAAMLSPLASPPVTEGQVALMRSDNVADPAMPGLTDLGIAPTPLDTMAETIAQQSR